MLLPLLDLCHNNCDWEKQLILGNMSVLSISILNFFKTSLITYKEQNENLQIQRFKLLPT